MSYSLFIARPVGWQLEAPTVGTWLFLLGMSVARKPEISGVFCGYHHNSRIHLTRNQLVKQARDHGCTHILMLDPDMYPDIHVEESGQAFFDSAWEFSMMHPGSVVAAPQEQDG